MTDAAPDPGAGRVPAPVVARPAGQRTGARVFAWFFVSLFLVLGAWSLANPLTAAPDEPGNAIKAAAVVRGQLVGERDDPAQLGSGRFTVPAVVAFANEMPRCFAHLPEQPASCMPTPPDDAGALTPATSTASAENPLYYAVVGLPSLVPAGPATLYLMRLVNAALCALMLAWAFTQATTLRPGSWVPIGALLAVTPMVAFLGSSINPAALEVAAAAALWVSLSAVLRDDHVALRSRFVAIAIIASVFVNLGSLAPLLLAVVVLASVLSVPWSKTKGVLAERRTWPWLGMLGLATLAALIWSGTAGAFDGAGVLRRPSLGFGTAVQTSLGDTSAYIANMIGQFGWLDTKLPTWLVMFVAGALGTVVILGLALGRRRERTAILSLGFITIAGLTALGALQALYTGPVWAGRPFLSAAVGLPVLATYATARAVGDRARVVARRATILLGSAWVLYQAGAFVINVHRYQKGADAGLLAVLAGQWNPPLPASLLFGILVVGLLGTAAGCLRGTQHDDARTAAE